MTSLSFVTWKWAPKPGYRSTFGPDTVNVLRRMVARHYPHPHRFLCVTDEPKGIDPEVEIVPAWNDHKDVPSPAGFKNPSCYRRLRMFDPAVAAVFGPRFVSMDLDIVITADITPVVDRPEDFVIWGDTNPRTFYNGSLILMTAGARPQVWTTFHPTRSPMESRAAGHFGSDQGWISHCLGRGEATWTKKDGVYSYSCHIKDTADRALPANARMVVCHGPHDPWDQQLQSLEWVRRHYR